MATIQDSEGDAKSPWANAQGWEYDLLRSLSPTLAMKLWRRAFWRALGCFLLKWWAWPLLALLFELNDLLIKVVWNFGGLLGLVVVGVVFHLSLIPLFPALDRICTSLLRPFVQEELLRWVKEQLIPDRLPGRE